MKRIRKEADERERSSCSIFVQTGSKRQSHNESEGGEHKNVQHKTRSFNPRRLGPGLRGSEEPVLTPVSDLTRQVYVQVCKTQQDKGGCGGDRYTVCSTTTWGPKTAFGLWHRATCCVQAPVQVTLLLFSCLFVAVLLVREAEWRWSSDGGERGSRHCC